MSQYGPDFLAISLCTQSVDHPDILYFELFVLSEDDVTVLATTHTVSRFIPVESYYPFDAMMRMSSEVVGHSPVVLFFSST